MNGSVISSARLNIRRGAPTTSAPIAFKVEAGTTLGVQGMLQGENALGNGEWYSGSEDTFFWSGPTYRFEPNATSGSSLPSVRRRPNGSIRPLGEADIRGIFGDLSHTALDGGRVKLETGWEASHIAPLATPALASVGYAQLALHIKAAEPFRRVLAHLADASLIDRIVTCAGTFVPRHKGWDRNRSLSSHTWGIAIDLNVAWNAYGATPAPTGATGSVRELVPYLEAEGFAWGRHFELASLRDGMHFELARLDIQQ